MIGPVRTLDEVLAAEAAARVAALGDLDPADVLEDPAAHPWRTVDAALERSTCPECGGELGAGARGCWPCDLADGNRFLAREPDRPGVPPGNEHAVRVALTVVRFPHRWPASAVEGDRLLLPLFAAGDLPTKEERYAIVAAVRAGRTADLVGARSFAELADRARRLAAPGAPRTAPS